MNAGLQHDGVEIAPAPLEPLCVDRAQLAVLLGISERLIYRLDSSGLLPSALAFGGCRRWSIEEIKAWIRAGAPPRQRWIAMWRSEQ